MMLSDRFLRGAQRVSRRLLALALLLLASAAVPSPRWSHRAPIRKG